MPILLGARFGPYEIVAPVGAGGMGEVYKARDTRLDRIVAIKVLPEQFATDPQFRERFEREAKAISKLSHPHICTLHDVGREAGIEYLVMEYLEGQTLAQKLEKGALSLDEALRYAIQIADALDNAHRHGIVHRDLKPGNIVVTKSGAKLLDFGLAKAAAAVIDDSTGSMMPTAPPLTAQGAIAGTLQYMAPEQLEAKETDSRTDIFAFGAVLYEMLTGRKAFEGTSQASLIAAILEHEPAPLAATRPLTPPSLDHIVRRCLAKKPDDRWQSARDVMLELKSSSAVPQQSMDSLAFRTRTGLRERVAWTLAVASLIGLTAMTWLRSGIDPELARVARLSILPPERTMFMGGYAAPHLAVSPDGRQLAFVPTPIGGATLLWVRSVDSLAARSLAGTDGASFPFWSPDGRTIAFFAGGRLKTIESSGSAPEVICDAPESRGGAWGQDGTIVFAPRLEGPLYRVPASGGQAVALTSLDSSRQEVSHRLPSFLPDGRHFLFFAQSGMPGNSSVYIGSLDSSDRRRLNISESKAIYAAGCVLFSRNQSLVAQPFDLNRFELVGELASLGDRLAFRTTVAGDAIFTVSDSGTLAYWSGGGSNTHLTWFNRRGEPLGVLGPPGMNYSFALSPDERTVAVEAVDPATQVGTIWTIDVTSGIRSRFSVGQGWNWGPRWSPDGTRVVFGSLRAGPSNLYHKATTGSGPEDLLLKSTDFMGVTDWSSDGEFLVIHNMTRFAVGALPLKGELIPTSVNQTEFLESDGRLSSDRRWLAYTSNESGSWEIYVQPFPSRDRKWRVSPDGGSRPEWRHDGKELFYVSGDQRLMAVPVVTGSGFAAGTPEPLFQVRMVPLPPTQPRQQYAVTAKADRFLVNTVVEPTTPAPLTVVLNWTAGLKK